MNAKSIKEQVDSLCWGLSAQNALTELDLALANPHSQEYHTALLAKRDAVQNDLDAYARMWEQAHIAAAKAADRERWEHASFHELVEITRKGNVHERMIANAYLEVYH